MYYPSIPRQAGGGGEAEAPEAGALPQGAAQRLYQHTNLSLSLSIYIYICIHICKYICMCVYI